MSAYTWWHWTVDLEESFPKDAAEFMSDAGEQHVNTNLPGPFIVARINPDMSVPGGTPIVVVALSKGTACTMYGTAAMVHELGHEIDAGHIPAGDVPKARQARAAALAIVSYLATCVKAEMEVTA